MDGLIIKYEWLSRDFIYLKEGYQNSFMRNAPMLFECNNLTIRYDEPEGYSKYGSYVGIVGGREFEFATLNLDKTSKEEADRIIHDFFLNRPSS